MGNDDAEPSIDTFKETCGILNCSITKDNDKTVGHIYEYTTYQGSEKIKACADFYVEDDYVSVVGNKSSGLLCFKENIKKFYFSNEGRMLGDEVREDFTISGITGTYNTLGSTFGISKVSTPSKLLIRQKGISQQKAKWYSRQISPKMILLLV